MKKVLKFSASWCGPCKAMAKVIEAAGDKIRLSIEDIDIDTNPVLVKQYQIRSVPTLVIVDVDGRELSRSVGMSSEDAVLRFLAS